MCCCCVVLSVGCGVLRSFPSMVFLHSASADASALYHRSICLCAWPTATVDSYCSLFGVRLLMGLWFSLSRFGFRQVLYSKAMGTEHFGAPFLYHHGSKLALCWCGGGRDGAQEFCPLSVIKDVCFVSVQNPRSKRVLQALWLQILKPFPRYGGEVRKVTVLYFCASAILTNGLPSLRPVPQSFFEPTGY